MRLLFIALAATVSLTVGTPVQAQSAPRTPSLAEFSANSWFARVNGTEISVTSFDQAARETFKSKFYHGTPPEEQVNFMLREVGEMLIDQVLLQREVKQRNIQPDAAEVQGQIDKLEQRYGSSPAWQEQRAQTLPNLRAHFEEKSRQSQLCTGDSGMEF